MILGKIIGKSTTNSFKFLAKGEVKKFQYVQALSKENYVLGQIIEIEKTHESIAECILLGYREHGILKSLRVPLEPGSEVLEADDSFIQKTLGLEQKEGAFIGHLEDRENVKVYLDFNTLLTKHITILAKSGAGKSYLTSVILEEFLEKNIPLVIIDPHGEYSSLKYPNDSEKLIAYGLKPKGYLKQIQEFTLDETGIPLRLNNRNLEAQELIHLLPAKLSSIQLGILYSALHHLESIDFESLKLHLDMEESNAKWTLINIIEYVENLHLFSDSSTPMEDLVQVGKASLINLRGVQQELQEIIVYKLLKDLFLERKKGNIPPFFLVIEEAHNFSPERNFGEAKSSSVIRQIFAEGRKFGLSVCLVSQRPSRVDKCIHPETWLITGNGRFVTVEKLYNEYKSKSVNNIFAYDFHRHKMIVTKVKHIVKNQRLEKIYRIETSRGYFIKCTREHKFFVLSKGKIIERKASKLRKKDILLVNKRVYIRPDDKLKIDTGYLKILKDRKKRIKSRIICYGLLQTKDKEFLSKKYKVPTNTIKNWLLGIQKPVYFNYVEYIDRDYIFGNNMAKESQPIPLIKKISPELVQLFALIIAESHEDFRTSYYIRFSNKDLDLTKLFENLIYSLFKYRVITKYKKDRHIYLSKASGLLLKEYFESIGYCTCMKSRNKDIPDFILKASIPNIKAFLRILFECDGGVTKGGVVLTSISQKIIIKTSFLLKRLSINHTIYRKILKVKRKNYLYWHIIILAHGLAMYSEEVGFYSKRKNMELQTLIQRLKKSRKLIINDYVPFAKRDIFTLLKTSSLVHRKILSSFSKITNKKPLTINQVKKILPYLPIGARRKIKKFIDSDILTDRIKFITIEKPSITYDVETEHKNFLANFIVTHNSTLSQATTQIVLKITNPHDVRAVTSSMEGITLETEKEIRNLSVGSALLSGVLDTPLFVTIRPRRSKHGGSSVMVVPQEQEGDLLPLIQQRISIKDMKVVHGNVKVQLIPCGFFRCFATENFNLVVNLYTGEIIQDIETLQSVSINNVELSVKQDKVFQSALRLQTFSAAELFERSGLQFSEIYETLKILTEKGYLVKEKDLFKVSKMFDLSNLKFYGSIEYGNISFDEKLEERFSLEEMRNKLSKYVEVKEKKPCWLVSYI